MHKKGLAFLKAMKALAFLNLGFHEKNCGNNLVIVKKSTYAHTSQCRVVRSDNFERTFWYPRILPKNERTNSFLVLLGKKNSFVRFLEVL